LRGEASLLAPTLEGGWEVRPKEVPLGKVPVPTLRFGDLVSCSWSLITACHLGLAGNDAIDTKLPQTLATLSDFDGNRTKLTPHVPFSGGGLAGEGVAGTLIS